MRTKQARKSVAVESQQLTLFSLFDAQSSENPLTQALPAGGQRHSHSRVGSLPKPSSSGPAFSENPTTTALYGRPQGDSDLSKDRAPVQELAHRVRDLLRDEPDTKLDNPRLNELAREVFGTAVGNARDAYDAAEAGMNLHIDGLDIDGDDAAATVQANCPHSGRYRAYVWSRSPSALPHHAVSADSFSSTGLAALFESCACNARRNRWPSSRGSSCG